jgi:hypothetical protein
VPPRTGRYKHTWKDSKGNPKEEWVEYEYQSIAEVFKRVIMSLVMEHCNDISEVKNIYLILGGDHGIGAFRMPFRTIIILQNGTVVKRDVGIATINCTKDSSKVIVNTILEWLTEDLKLINDLNIVLTKAKSGVVECKFEPKSAAASSAASAAAASTTVTITNVEIFITGDIKWFCMLLGM